ncbi:uncharacterized protein METZ01_LOCUS385476 [marine metagenome]|uniref:Uncharacterized protein n=1 Tax=marine metagenome TaxID=408172 RepID=A0A382UET6_9ZZZZ
MRFNTDQFASDNNFDTPENVDAEYVTEQSMSALWDLVIAPMQDQLTDEDKTLIAVIGMTFKLVAHKAKCYEDIQKGNHDKNSLN